MKIAIAFRPPLRLWQQRLAEALIGLGHEIVFRPGARRQRRLGTAAALAVQHRVFGPRPSLFDRGSTAKLDRPTSSEDTAPDLTIRLDGEQSEGAALEPLFRGRAGDAALIAMLLDTKAHEAGRCVRVRLRHDAGSFDVVVADLAIQDPDVLSRALDQALTRLITLMLQGVRRFERGRASIAQGCDPSIVGPPTKSPLLSMLHGLLRKAAARLSGKRGGPSHWRIGHRLVGDASGLHRDREWAGESFAILPDDRSRFYADPVPFVHEGRRYVFLEDYPYATGKAVIAVTEIGADGVASPPRTVLEQACHLSYPFILRHGGDIFMLPEMSAAGRVQLFRAASFPDRWVADRVLLDGVVAADATLVERGGRWWMFATLSDDGGSSWDQLCLFHAPDVFGPWTPHADNPVLVDAGASRPAGAMWEEDGTLMRVAQDCRAGYGRGLAICRVDRLDESGYAQTVVARLAPPDGYGADGVHTLARAGDLEVIDLRFPPAGR